MASPPPPPKYLPVSESVTVFSHFFPVLEVKLKNLHMVGESVTLSYIPSPLHRLILRQAPAAV